jgi:hypothetical protein
MSAVFAIPLAVTRPIEEKFVAIITDRVFPRGRVSSIMAA